MTELEFRRELYSLFAEAIKEPTVELVAEMPDYVKFMGEAFSFLRYDISLLDYQNWPQLVGTTESLREDYYRSFVYPPDKRVVPVESIYRQWTQDSTAQVAFANEKGYLMSDAALHMQALYSEYGLELPSEFQSMPDHLCLELEFAAFLLDHETPERFVIYLKDHLTWIHELEQEAVDKEVPLFYRQLIKVIAHFVQCELSNLNAQ